MTSNEPVELNDDELDFFNSLDVDSAAEDPYAHPVGPAEFEISSAVLARGAVKDDGSQSLGVVFTFTSDHGQVTHWMNVPKAGAKNVEKQLSFMRAFLNSIGVPSDEHKFVLAQLVKRQEDKAVVGKKVVGTVVNKDGRQNLTKISPRGTRVGASPSKPASSTVSASDDDFI